MDLKSRLPCVSPRPLQVNEKLEELDVTRNFIQDIEITQYNEFNRDNQALQKIDLRCE